MRILLATLSRNRKGQPVRTERIIEAETPAVGRGAQCVIHLPDPRVALEHATIFSADGAQRIAGVGTALLVVEGRPEGELVLAPGSRFEIGPYQFVVEQPPQGIDLALAVELVRPMPDDLAEIKSRSRFSLAASGVSKRKMAWVLLGLVAFLFLLIPVINAVTPLRGVTSGTRLPPDLPWNPGKLSIGHAGLTQECRACHKIPFLRVRDAQCLDCHENMPGHVHDAKLQAKLFGGTRCAECHEDHRGDNPPVPQDPVLCSSCHGNLHSILSTTNLRDATNFSGAHPDFKITLWRGPGPNDVVRVLQKNKDELVERSNLKYPHDVHLKPNIRGPKGRVTLECKSCHVPDAAGKSFLPVEMKKNCIDCHTLEFEPARTDRQVPHGSVREALLTMQEFYANISLSNVAVDTVDTGDIRRGIPKPSAGIVTEEQKKRALEYARAKAEQVGVDLFEKRVCVVCHDVSRTGVPSGSENDVQWNVAPVRLTAVFMPEARFDHGKHRTSKCEDCHDKVKTSKRSADVNIPDIESCRVCHAGNTPEHNKVVSTCVTCHAYHLPGVTKIKRTAPATAEARP
jgi:hypothetical protein